jgi:hypothetical protein
MKIIINKLAFIALLVSFSFLSYGQRTEWFALTTNHLNFETSDYFKKDAWQHNWTPSRVAVAIPLSDHFKFYPSFALANVQGTKDWVTKKQLYWDLNANVIYSIIPDKRIEPYLLAGGGVDYINEQRGVC